MAQVVVNGLRKVYRVPEREAGLGAAVRSLFRRRYRDVLAVDNIHFAVNPGEMVGLIGPNGAGKTTTLKVLSGLLYPTAGEVRVAGFIPWQRKPGFLHHISMVMGNRQQLWWDNTVLDSFFILGEIYHIPRPTFRQTLDELASLLEIGGHLAQMPRNLSLGQRMKCELAAALLHRPQVLFLDEPTLGLDVTMQFRLRRFIAEYNRQSGATVILTSHYMADVVELCPRVILIHEGRLLFDGTLARLAEQMAPFRLIRVSIDGENGKRSVDSIVADLGEAATVLEHEGRQYTLRVRKADTSAITAQLLNDVSLEDLTIENPPIEAVIDRVYREGVKQ